MDNKYVYESYKNVSDLHAERNVNLLMNSFYKGSQYKIGNLDKNLNQF